jgi:type IV pilus assembly protein PilA
MPCPHCGAELIPGNRFCSRCRKRVEPAGVFEAPAPAASAYAQALEPENLDMRRPSWVTVVAILDFVFGGLVLAWGVVIALLGFHEKDGAAVLWGMGGAALLLGGFIVATGVGLIRLKAWARVGQIVVSSLGLIQIPCGTVVGAFVLIYLLKPGVKVLFSGRDVHELTPREAVDVANLSQPSSGGGMSTAAIVVLAVVAPFILIACIGIIAAIAIPSLLRARIAANEADAIGDTRTVVSAEVAYQQANGNRYGKLECLAEPSTCLTGYTGQAFLDRGVAESPKQGYKRRLTLSEDGKHYTYYSVPVTVNGTGTRSFCTDETGAICQVRDGGHPLDEDGACDRSRCVPL